MLPFGIRRIERRKKKTDMKKGRQATEFNITVFECDNLVGKMIIIILERQLKYFEYENSERKHLKDARKITYVNKEYELWSIKKYKLPQMVVWHVSHQPWAYSYGFRLWLLYEYQRMEKEIIRGKITIRSVPIRCDLKKKTVKKPNSWISILKIEVISNAIFAFVPCKTITIWYVHFWNTRYFMYEIESKLKPLMRDSIAW